MTFEEWFEEHQDEADNPSALCRMVWNAAQAQEREACAKICDECAIDGKGYREYTSEVAEELAEKIRARR
jgi:hypothetical protein